MTANQLRSTLRSLRLTQSAAARQLGVDPRTVRKWIAGESRIPESVAILLRSRSDDDYLPYLVAIAETNLRQPTDAATTVAALFGAIAFEYTLKRMARGLPGVRWDVRLHESIGALRRAGILRGTKLRAAMALVRFHHDATRGRFAKINRAKVREVLGFVEQLPKHLT